MDLRRYTPIRIDALNPAVGTRCDRGGTEPCRAPKQPAVPALFRFAYARRGAPLDERPTLWLNLCRWCSDDEVRSSPLLKLPPEWDPKQRGLFATQSKEEALALLVERRARLLDLARTVLYQIGDDPLGVTTQDVLAEMERQGLLDVEDRKLDQRWIGALWAGKNVRDVFERVGYKMQSNDARNCHKAPRAAWRKKRQA